MVGVDDCRGLVAVGGMVGGGRERVVVVCGGYVGFLLSKHIILIIVTSADHNYDHPCGQPKGRY